jgi:hypothetical protein
MRKIFTLILLAFSFQGFSQSTTIVISQLYGAGGNAGAAYTADYVELHNISSVSQSLSGMSIQYASATSTTTWSGVASLPAVSIPAGGYFLIQMSGAGAVGAAIPTPDHVATPPIAMSGTNGRVALVNGTTALSACPTTPDVIDLVGYGTSVCFEGSAATAALTATNAAIRNNNGCAETNNNGADFTVAPAAPKNSASPVVACGVVPVGPAITAGAVNNFGNVVVLTNSASQSFSISGSNLTGAPGNITITAPSTDFQVSINNTTWGASANIAFTSATLASTLVYARFTPQTAGLKTGNISISGGGITTPVAVAVSGNGTTTTPTTGGLVISQIYGAGGNSGALFNADYVEIHNKSTATQSLQNYSIQYASSTTTTTWSGKSNLPAVNIPAGGYYLIQMSATGTIGSTLPTPDYLATPTIAMSASNGRVALVSDTFNLVACPTTANVVDLVGYGTSVCFEGSAAVGALDTLRAGFRNNNGCDDTNNNLADFTINTPAPRNSTSPVAVCGVIPTNPTLSSGTLTSFGTVCLGNTAGPNSFNVSGSNLTAANIIVGPLSGYAFSLTSGGAYTPSLSITQTGGALAATTVYVNFTPTAAQSYSGSIPVAGGGATAIFVAATGTGAAIVTPSFNAMNPVCQGGNFSLPPTSTNGISGTWAPAINNTATTTYTFTPGTNQCAVSTTMTVVVNPNVVPVFTQPAPICSGTSYTLPADSDNGITGSWSPAFDNTTTTTYTFAPGAGQCATSTTLTIEVIPAAPTVITGDSTDIQANAATLHGTITFQGCTNITEYGIEISSINGFTPGTGYRVPSANQSNNMFSASVNGLVQNTVYFYRAYARNANAIAYGEEKLFFTKPIPAGLVIYGTPVVRGTTLHYSLSGIQPGHYAVRIYNVMGQLVLQKDIIAQVNFIDTQLQIPASLPIGLYTFQIFNPSFKIQKSLMIQ